jgi:hypothetical protein
MRSTQLAWRFGLRALGVFCLTWGALWSQVTPASDRTASVGRGGPTDAILITGAVEHPKSLTLAVLKREPATTETVSLMTERGDLTASYTGVLLWTVLEQAIIKLSPGTKNDILRHTIVVTGRDGYEVVLSVAEIDPKFGNDRAIIAYTRNGKPLTRDRRFARLIVPTDKSAGRAVFGIARITVR